MVLDLAYVLSFIEHSVCNLEKEGKINSLEEQHVDYVFLLSNTLYNLAWVNLITTINSAGVLHSSVTILTKITSI